MRTGVPCNENRVFSVGIVSHGVPCEPYRVWVYSVSLHKYVDLFWDHKKKSVFSSKFVQLEFLDKEIGQISVSQIFLVPIRKCASARSMLLEVV